MHLFSYWLTQCARTASKKKTKKQMQKWRMPSRWFDNLLSNDKRQWHIDNIFLFLRLRPLYILVTGKVLDRKKRQKATSDTSDDWLYIFFNYLHISVNGIALRGRVEHVVLINIFLLSLWIGETYMFEVLSSSFKITKFTLIKIVGSFYDKYLCECHELLSWWES